MLAAVAIASICSSLLISLLYQLPHGMPPPHAPAPGRGAQAARESKADKTKTAGRTTHAHIDTEPRQQAAKRTRQQDTRPTPQRPDRAPPRARIPFAHPDAHPQIARATARSTNAPHTQHATPIHEFNEIVSFVIQIVSSNLNLAPN